MSEVREIRLTVNGKSYQGRCEPRKLLVDFVREDLGLTGTHIGCEHGICGACTIMFNGEAARSCLMFAVQADGAELMTVEGLAKGDEWHPLQQAFHEHHALQCGFCTPGMLIAALDFLATNPAPTEDEIREGISSVLCRCTGYVNIVKAVAAAAEVMRACPAQPLRAAERGEGEGQLMSERGIPYVGRSLLRREDRRLLTGRGQFVADLELPRMLHAAFIRSPVAHARIRSVDLSRAAAAPGVALALSGADLVRLLPPLPDTQLSLPSKWMSRVQHEFHNPQQPGLAYDKVRHVGEAVAVIVAESRYAAEDAAELVTFDFEPLPAVVSAEAALASGAPLIHEHLKTNLFGAFSIAKGDVAAAMAARAAQTAAPVLSSPLRRDADRMPRRRRHSRPADRYDNDLVGDPGRALGAPGGCRDPRPAGSACALSWRSMSAAGSASRGMSTPRIW